MFACARHLSLPRAAQGARGKLASVRARHLFGALQDLDLHSTAPEALRLAVVRQVDVDLVALDRAAGVGDDVLSGVGARVVDANARPDRKDLRVGRDDSLARVP